MVGMLVGYEYSVQSFRRDIQAGKLRFIILAVPPASISTAVFCVAAKWQLPFEPLERGQYVSISASFG